MWVDCPKEGKDQKVLVKRQREKSYLKKLIVQIIWLRCDPLERDHVKELSVTEPSHVSVRCSNILLLGSQLR